MEAGGLVSALAGAAIAARRWCITARGTTLPEAAQGEGHPPSGGDLEPFGEANARILISRCCARCSVASAGAICRTLKKPSAEAPVMQRKPISC